MTVIVEAAVDTFVDALAAQGEGVHRLELCGPLHEGGTTPSAGLIARCSEKLLVSVHALIRPRAGSFVYCDDEIEIMKKDIAIAKELGVDGVVIGALTPDDPEAVVENRRRACAALVLSTMSHAGYFLIFYFTTLAFAGSLSLGDAFSIMPVNRFAAPASIGVSHVWGL
mgnify:CR=1 FL=1